MKNDLRNVFLVDSAPRVIEKKTIRELTVDDVFMFPGAKEKKFYFVDCLQNKTFNSLVVNYTPIGTTDKVYTTEKKKNFEVFVWTNFYNVT